MNNRDAFELAAKKARYGHRDWIVWKDRADEYHAETLTRESLKKALLANGTRRKWWIITGSSAGNMLGFWSMGIIMLRNFRHA